MQDAHGKSRLWQEVLAAAEARVAGARAEVSGLQEALGSEAKSSAGDKHETGRAMVQQELERAVLALQQAQVLAHALTAQEPASGPPARWGSWVVLDRMQVVIAQALGRVETHLGPVQVISAEAPLARTLINAQAAPGDAVEVNGRKLVVNDVR